MVADGAGQTAVAQVPRTRWAERRRVLIPVLIAVTSVLGAVGAWRASVASGAAGGAERRAFSDTVAAELQDALLETQLASLEFTYARAVALQASADQLRADAAEAPDDLAERLTALAGAYESTAATLRSFLDADAVGSDGTLDLEAARERRLALAADLQDLDPEPERAAMSHYRARAERLVGLTALLVAAALFLTLAEVSRNPRVGMLFWDGGIVVLVGALALLFVVELL